MSDKGSRKNRKQQDDKPKSQHNLVRGLQLSTSVAKSTLVCIFYVLFDNR